MRGYGDRSFVSWRNFEGAETPSRRLVVHDVTLRDGEQQAGVIFTGPEKIEIAKALAALGVDRVEAGMVAVSEEDRDTVRALAGMDLPCEIWTIARSLVSDIRLSVEAGAAGIGVIILANDQYCKVFGWSVEEAVAMAVGAAEAARSEGVATTLLLADSSRMSAERLEQIVGPADRSGAYQAIALMDTFGALDPRGAANLVRAVRSLTDLPIEFHAHNDFGLGTANTLAALEAGADVVHTSVLGLGERVGNAPLEEVAVASALLHERPHRLKLERLAATADLVRRHAGVAVAPNKPVVGTSYRQIESGTVATEHQRLTARGEDLQWLFPFRPDLVGAGEVELVIGKGSGLANVQAALRLAGLELEDEAARGLLGRAKSEALRLHRALTPAEFSDLARQAGAGHGR
jgi:isopropylmalate/homocitrate/citramalate synthase